MKPFVSGLTLVFFLGLSAVFVKLVLRQSAEPWVFGFYTLPYFVFLLLSGVSLLVFGVWLGRGGERARKIFWVNLLLFGVMLLGIEMTGQAYAFFHPSYDVLLFTPDRATGWRFHPNKNWIWAGSGLYQQEFKTAGESNSLGFRDRERPFEKPSGTVRIALLGDSFVVALEVPFEQTAGNLLEEKLNRKGGAFQYEVLNFGISSYSVGQYLLTWEEYASKFSPDYVFIFLFRRPFERTATPYEMGAFPHTKKKGLWVRPAFHLENGELIHEPARDFGAFQEVHEEVSKKDFGGKRNMRRRRGFFLMSYAQAFVRIGKSHFVDPLLAIQRRFTANVILNPVTGSLGRVDLPPDVVELAQINLKAIEEMGGQVKRTGATLILVDIFSYLNPEWAGVSEILQEFSLSQGLGYLPLGEELLKAEKQGLRVRWKSDPHFNAKGNEIFSESMLNWVRKNSL